MVDALERDDAAREFAMGTKARVPLITPGTNPDLADVERAIAAGRGRISPLYRALLNSPPVASGWEKLLTAVRKQTRVPPALRELIILRVAVVNGAPYEFDAHVSPALAAGLSQSKIDAVRSGSASTGDHAASFDDDERLVLELADTMTRDVAVPDGLVDRLRVRFDARTLVEVVTTVAAYNMVSRLVVALDLGHGP